MNGNTSELNIEVSEALNRDFRMACFCRDRKPKEVVERLLRSYLSGASPAWEEPASPEPSRVVESVEMVPPPVGGNELLSLVDRVKNLRLEITDRDICRSAGVSDTFLERVRRGRAGGTRSRVKIRRLLAVLRRFAGDLTADSPPLPSADSPGFSWYSVRPREAHVSEKDQPTSFEDRLRRLEEILERLERGEISLEESIVAYEEGAAALGDCYAALAAAEERLEVVMGRGDEADSGEPNQPA